LKLSKLIVYLLSFFLYLCYTYNGDNMDRGDIIINIKNMDDVKNINDNTKYINLCLDKINIDVIDYFLLNGKDYLYSDSFNDKNGYIYTNYDMFKDGEALISKIINDMPNDLSDIEKLRYIYIYLGKILCSDINVMDDKNEDISFNNISNINNIWSAISGRKVSDVIISKIFMYICFRCGFKCELVSTNIKGNLANKVYVDNNFLVVDLYSDLHNIQGGFATKYFDKYNDNKDIDMKICYIKDDYMDVYLDNILKNIDYNSENAFEDILYLTSNIINVSNIGTLELCKIYKSIFDKYMPLKSVKVNNLFVCGNSNIKSHFTLFNYNDNYYSFNYNKGIFMSLDYNVLYNNIKNNVIGIYENEEFELEEARVVL